MSETVSDSPETQRILDPFFRARESACGGRVIYGFQPRFNFHQLLSVNGKLFDSNTCLMATRNRVEEKRIPVVGNQQIEWGGREVSPSYRKFLKLHITYE
jgi:hypothetical protein